MVYIKEMNAMKDVFSLQNDIFIEKEESLSNSDGSNNVRSSMFDRSKAKIGCSSSITNWRTCSFVQSLKK